MLTIPADTLAHLRRWVETSGSHDPDHANRVYDAMASFLRTLDDAEDLETFTRDGWSRVADYLYDEGILTVAMRYSDDS